MARTSTPVKKPLKPAKKQPSRAAKPAAKSTPKPGKRPPPVKSAPAKPASRQPVPASKAKSKPAPKAPAKPAPKVQAKPPAKAASKPKPQAKSPAPAPASTSAKAPVVPPRPPNSESAQVDPLLAGGQASLKLVGGHERDAQLPTTLVPKPDLPAAVPLTVHAQAVPGAAQHGNSLPANLLILVSCGGWPVADLNEDHFSVMEHFDVPGQSAPFSNNIVSFRNNGSGAYLIQIRPIGGAPWAGGQHLAQILVSSPDERHGQTAAKLIVR